MRPLDWRLLLTLVLPLSAQATTIPGVNTLRGPGGASLTSEHVIRTAHSTCDIRVDIAGANSVTLMEQHDERCIDAYAGLVSDSIRQAMRERAHEERVGSTIRTCALLARTAAEAGVGEQLELENDCRTNPKSWKASSRWGRGWIWKTGPDDESVVWEISDSVFTTIGKISKVVALRRTMLEEDAARAHALEVAANSTSLKAALVRSIFDPMGPPVMTLGDGRVSPEAIQCIRQYQRRLHRKLDGMDLAGVELRIRLIEDSGLLYQGPDLTAEMISPAKAYVAKLRYTLPSRCEGSDPAEIVELMRLDELYRVR